ncbi:1-deoxy-D-xylulose-5-phosphate reductoisomerase [Oribacterium sp. WCC10]|uniref:1-deoxy-D-xylulose-5-phosphate reductoisomerase n=1 Tax=Oribacterium sp. WCC10 TaxID=1855343 RepID=UPI0008DFF7A6|nr:1-deoxy-D-xylulose-5-phosphate reductoisomerase [Oribacterium sp. WCC10]SFG09316.1 1-deoxy-D-xylulose 5-phosphate reductoisomerase [Oribacterium sp. WCC10]
MRRLVILGSTGSIGTQTIDVIKDDPEIVVTGLAVYGSIEKLREQVEKLHPETVCIYDETKAEIFRSYGLPVKVLSGMDGLIEISTMQSCDEVVVSVVGMIGIQPTIAALKAHKKVALANKETLVCAGHIIMPLAEECGIEIKPIDSEHSAIWQSLTGEPHNRIEQILLTASGGPFRGKKREDLRGKTKEDALKHPNWAMGRKITIDSSTMVNKGLEVLEAHWLFDVPVDMIKVVVQPQSIVHSAVQYVDGSVKAQLGLPDMRIPIEYALYAPDRHPLTEDKRLDLAELATLTFENPDMETFKGLALGYRAGRTGGSMPTVYNAANEEAVAMFLENRIDFLEIADVIEEAMDAHEKNLVVSPTLQEILSIEKWARDFVKTNSMETLT